jgi:hypothetical protein
VGGQKSAWRSPCRRRVQKVIIFVVQFKLILFNFLNTVCELIIAVVFIITLFSAAPFSSEEPATGPYPEPDASSPHVPILSP